MKKLGVLMATAALTLTTGISAFAYHGYCDYNVRNNDRRICDNYICDDNYRNGCAENYEACYGGYCHRSGSYRMGRR
ncbi:hypothetical protein [Oribacterium sp. C9]|uniref:hypothetical protein n=1 Tax=Oribacterium sp. C9 TaxID=1943579 RepID=UPI0011158FC0|nr:hypothetical protein [Oribacterium sp. C9]